MRTRLPSSIHKAGERSAFPYLFTFFFLVALVESWRRVGVDLSLFVEGQGREHLWKFLRGMFPPALSAEFLSLMVRPALETVQISVMGTLIAILLGFPLGVLATRTFSVGGVLNEAETQGAPVRLAARAGTFVLARGVLSLFRSIPEFVWAFMFVRAVGLGPFAGVLAIGVAYGGMLGKVYSEIFEAVNPRPLEALQSTGANRLQIFCYGWLPQVLPNFVSYTLYRWECAVRASAILGLVGAGGLGQQIEISMRMFNFNEVLTLLMILFAMVAAVDFISAKIRASLVGAARRSENRRRLPWPSPSGRPKPALSSRALWALLAAIGLWSYWGSEIRLGLLFSREGAGEIASYLRKLFPPDLSPEMLRGTFLGAVETFAISFLGTLLAVAIALSVVFFASRNLMYSGPLYEMERDRWWRRGLRLLPYLCARSLLNVLRTIPEMVWALVFVFLVGLGPFAGALALGVHTGGVLGKLFAEVLEDVNPQPVESLQSTGAGKLQILFYGILPQVLPQFVSYTLYRWEVNIRVAAVLGFVGAGGLGQRIHVAISLFLENQLLTLLCGIYILVTAADYLSAYLRRRLL